MVTVVVKVVAALQVVVLAALLVAPFALGRELERDMLMAIVFPGVKFDGSFNEATWQGMKRAISELEGTVATKLLEAPALSGNPTDHLLRVVQEGAQLIVAPGFQLADAVQEASGEFPDVNFVLIDAVVENPNVRSVLFKEHEGSYLVGYIAGSLTQTGVVGFVGGMDIPLIRAFHLGYVEGVHAACSECRVVSHYIGVTGTAWNNPSRARELAALQHARGADILYAAAGGSGRGVIDFVNETMCYTPKDPVRSSPLTDMLAELPTSEDYARQCGMGDQPLFFIGVDSNQNFLGDTDDNPTTLNHGLTSMLKRVDVAAYQAVYDVVNGNFTGGIQVLGLAEDGVGYALDTYNRALLPKSLIEAVEKVRQQIIDGEIIVTDYRSLE